MTVRVITRVSSHRTVNARREPYSNQGTSVSDKNQYQPIHRCQLAVPTQLHGLDAAGSEGREGEGRGLSVLSASFLRKTKTPWGEKWCHMHKIDSQLYRLHAVLLHMLK